MPRRDVAAQAQIGLPLNDVAGLSISHEHDDHVAGAAQIGSLGVPLFMKIATFDVPSQKLRHTMPCGRVFLDPRSLPCV